MKNKELSKPFQKIEIYKCKNGEVELIGMFKNGDMEVKYTDGTLAYRIPKKTFLKKFKRLQNG